MEIGRSLDDYGERIRRRPADGDVRRQLAALEVVRDYFAAASGLAHTEQIGLADLLDFSTCCLIESGEASPSAARQVLDVVAAWLGGAPLGCEDAAARRLVSELRKEVPRALEAAALLAGAGPDLESLGTDAELGDEAGDPLGTLSAGLARIVELDAADRGQSALDYYRVTRIEGDRIELQPVIRRPLGPEIGGFASVDERAAKALRVGDILNADLMPAREGVRVLEVARVYPAGLHGVGAWNP